AYMQLDSWWYPKGPNNIWSDGGYGLYQYTADLTLFPNDLAGFQQQLGLPLMTHCRWIDSSSPYNTQYALATNTSGGRVAVDMNYWTNRMAYLTNGGVATFEHDWLDVNALPPMNLNDPPAFMNGMAAAANACGVNLQYCMA